MTESEKFVNYFLLAWNRVQLHCVVKVKQSPTGLDRPWGFQEGEAPKFQDSRHKKVVGLSALRTGCLYPSINIPGAHFCWELSRPQSHSATGRIMSMKNSNGTLGNRTRGFPACSAVPHPTAPPRPPAFCCKSCNEPRRPIKMNEFCGQLLKKGSVPRKHT